MSSFLGGELSKCHQNFPLSLSVARACLFIETLVILVENETFSISHYEMKCDESLDTHIMTKNYSSQTLLSLDDFCFIRFGLASK